MYKVAFEKAAEKEFLRLNGLAKELVAAKILELHDGNFSNDKPHKGKHTNSPQKRSLLRKEKRFEFYKLSIF